LNVNGEILYVDDDQSMCELIEADFSHRGYQVVWNTSPAAALELLYKEPFDVVLVDLVMPEMDGIELCGKIIEIRPDIPVIMVTAFGSLDSAVSALRAGAFDFVTKPIEMDLLVMAVERARKHSALKRQVAILSEAVDQPDQFGRLIGRSPAMKRLFDQINRIAESDAPVLITGESGTGKELVAQELHKRSSRSSGPFTAINCSALPHELLESELFGHARGAFTDAKSARKGLLLQSDGGILFLDEIGDLPLTLQPKLLRALEERSFRPVGSDSEIRFDARIITATNQDLDSLVQAGSFREDLFFRINVIHLQVPPLRDRGNDILLIAGNFLKLYAARAGKPVRGFSEAVTDKLLSYPWPGNVRELSNAVERAVALAQFDRINVADLPEKISGYRSPDLSWIVNPSDRLVPLSEIERRYIEHVLDSVGGNKAMAARILGFDRKTLYRKLRQFEPEA